MEEKNISVINNNKKKKESQLILLTIKYWLAGKGGVVKMVSLIMPRFLLAHESRHSKRELVLAEVTAGRT